MKIQFQSIYADVNSIETLFHHDPDGLPITPFSEYDNRERQVCVRLISIAMEKLKPRERTILELKYGFASDPCSYAKVGGMLGLSKQRVCQIACNAKNTLSSIMKQLTNENDHSN